MNKLALELTIKKYSDLYRAALAKHDNTDEIFRSLNTLNAFINIYESCGYSKQPQEASDA